MRLHTVMKSRFTSRISSLLLVAAVVLFSSLGAFGEEGRITPSTPAWQRLALDGKMVSSSDFKGKVVILNFWATWCVPCREEIPGLVELQKQYGEKDLVVVGVSVDEGGRELVKRFVERLKIDYPVVIADEKMMRDFGSVEAVPTTFIMNRKGDIAGKHIGFTDRATLEKEIKPLL